MMVEYTWSEYLRSLPATHASVIGEGSWTDGETFESALRKMEYGDDTYASMADALLDKISDLTEGVPQREWTPGPYGAFPVVPEYLTGMPTCMRAMSPSGELSPVKIVVSTTCSGGISAETMTKRGVAVLALVMKLQQIRPVELYILAEGNGSKARNLFQLVKLDTKPLSIAHTCFALANVGFARALTYPHMIHYFDWDGRWPDDYRTAGYETIVRTECGMTPTDLWINSAYATDQLLRDPVKWVNNQLHKYTNMEVE